MSSVFIGDKEYFPGIGPIPYEGPGTGNPLAFRHYNAGEKVGDKTMKEHLRFSIAYWHSFCHTGADPFGGPTQNFPWDHGDPMTAARQRVDAAFEFISKIGAEFYCFHDRDMAPEGADPGLSEASLHQISDLAKERQEASGIKLLWGTANLFSHPRYMNGAATNPDFQAVAHAAAQVKTALDVTVKLGGQGYTFWGGREGYSTLWNTDLQREQEHLAAFLTAARDYGRRAGFQGVFYIEPKPMEPTKHQYDYDAATVAGFLRHYGLDKDFKINLEANHATLSGHDFVHELRTAREAGLLGSVDANRGDPRNGWDTDEFPTDVFVAVRAMLEILKMGGFVTGGLNFDARRRRNSTDLKDLFYAHIGGMDAFALGLKTAHRVMADGGWDRFIRQRYASFDSGMGAAFEKGGVSLEDMAALASQGEVGHTSGRQEYLENLINGFLYG